MQKCEDCAHKQVCGIIEQRIKLDARLLEAQSIVAGSDSFTVNVVCKYFLQDSGNTRESLE